MPVGKWEGYRRLGAEWRRHRGPARLLSRSDRHLPALSNPRTATDQNPERALDRSVRRARRHRVREHDPGALETVRGESRGDVTGNLVDSESGCHCYTRVASAFVVLRDQAADEGSLTRRV